MGQDLCATAGSRPTAAAFFWQRKAEQSFCANLSHPAVPGIGYNQKNTRAAVLRHNLCILAGMAESKKTVVLGASPNPSRYSYLAVNRLTSHNHPVVAIGKRTGKIGPVEIQTDHE